MSTSAFVSFADLPCFSSPCIRRAHSGAGEEALQLHKHRRQRANLAQHLAHEAVRARQRRVHLECRRR
jgi:hypothetical protein